MATLPQRGDIVRYLGTDLTDRAPVDIWRDRRDSKRLYIVLETAYTDSSHGRSAQCVEIREEQPGSWRKDEFFADPESLLVVQRAHYETVGD